MFLARSAGMPGLSLFLTASLLAQSLSGCVPSATDLVSPMAVSEAPVPGNLLVTIGPAVPGEDVAFSVSGLQPGELVYLVRASSDGGPWCPSGFGGVCLDLDPPVALAGSLVADVTGTASMVVALPASVPVGTEAWFQAIVKRGRRGSASTTSPTVRLVASDGLDGPDVDGARDDGSGIPLTGAGGDEASCPGNTYVWETGWQRQRVSGASWTGNMCCGAASAVIIGGVATGFEPDEAELLDLIAWSDAAISTWDNRPGNICPSDGTWSFELVRMVEDHYGVPAEVVRTDWCGLKALLGEDKLIAVVVDGQGGNTTDVMQASVDHWVVIRGVRDGYVYVSDAGRELESTGYTRYTEASFAASFTRKGGVAVVADVDGTSSCYGDADGDGYGLGGDGCFGPGDCDDGDANVHPGADEVCNGVDDSCDGVIDEHCPTCTDNDGDGYDVQGTCGPQDCDDGDSLARPGAPERSNLKDDDCDGIVDEGRRTCWERLSASNGYGQANPLANFAHCWSADGRTCVGGSTQQDALLSWTPDGRTMCMYTGSGSQLQVGAYLLEGLYSCRSTTVGATEWYYVASPSRPTVPGYTCTSSPIGYVRTGSASGTPSEAAFRRHYSPALSDNMYSHVMNEGAPEYSDFGIAWWAWR